jgi:uncharacterized membrane protein HdeD (DUF308 family)
MSTKPAGNLQQSFGVPAGIVQKGWGWFLALGVALIALGVMAISMPLVAAIAIELLIGWLLVAVGTVEMISAVGSQRGAGLFWSLLWGLVYLAVGVMLLADPLRGILTLTMLLAILLLAEGVFKIILAVQYRAMGNWGWTLFSGLLSMALGGLIWAQWPSDAAWIIGLLIGIDLIFGGWTMMILGMTAKRLPSGEELQQPSTEQPA